MKTLFSILLILALTLAPSIASAQVACDRSVQITAAAGTSATVATADVAQTVYVCSFLITGNTASTGVQFKSGTTNMTGVMLTPANGPLMYAKESPGLYGVYGQAVTIAATTGAITGFVNFAQR